MAVEIVLILVDAAPLITLAAAQSLDYLLYPDLPIVIPDAVFHEATASAGKVGAQEIIDWYRANTVRIEPTEIFQRETKLLELQGGRLARDLGERAALELVRVHPLGPEERALLLSDDRDAERLSITEPRRLILLTTWDFLRQLELAQRIQSADAVMAVVRKTGRSLSKRDLWEDHDPELREAVRKILSQSKTTSSDE